MEIWNILKFYNQLPRIEEGCGSLDMLTMYKFAQENLLLIYKMLSIMKPQVFFLSFAAFCLLLSCGSIKRSDTEEITNDTIVCKKEVQDHLAQYCTYEYFVISKGDTSAYSFVFRTRRAYPHDSNMEIVNWPRYKQYLIPKDTIISCYEPDYKGFLKEMDLCLNTALNEKCSINLKHIAFRLVNCTDIAVVASNMFYEMGKKDMTHQNILDALQKTSLKNDFDTILNKYGLHVANENCYEEIYLVKKKDFLNNRNYPNKEEVPDSILDVEIGLNVQSKCDEK